MSNSLLNNKYLNKLDVNRLQVNQLKANEVLPKIDSETKSYLYSAILNNAEFNKIENGDYNAELTINLTNHTQEIIQFTDRPFRQSSKINIQQFVQLFLVKEPNSFEEQPPNIVLIFNNIQKSYTMSFASELNNKVVFNLKLLNGEEHTQDNFIGTINVFVDDDQLTSTSEALIDSQTIKIGDQIQFSLYSKIKTNLIDASGNPYTNINKTITKIKGGHNDKVGEYTYFFYDSPGSNFMISTISGDQIFFYYKNNNIQQNTPWYESTLDPINEQNYVPNPTNKNGYTIYNFSPNTYYGTTPIPEHSDNIYIQPQYPDNIYFDMGFKN